MCMIYINIYICTIHDLVYVLSYINEIPNQTTRSGLRVLAQASQTTSHRSDDVADHLETLQPGHNSKTGKAF